MKKSVKLTLAISVATVLAITVISSVFSSIAMIKYFDHDIEHYARGAVSALAMYLPFLATAAATVCVVVTRKKVSFVKKPGGNIPTVFSSVLTGLLIAASSAFTLSAYLTPSYLSYIPTPSAITTVVIITGFISAVYFILYPFVRGRSYMTIFAFIPPVWAALKLLEEYFRDGGPINSPIRTANLTMFAFILLFLAEEIRFAIDTESVGIYYFCILNAIAFTGNAVIPKLIVIITGNNVFDFSFIECCLGAALLLFLLSRLLATPDVLGDSEAPENTDK